MEKTCNICGKTKPISEFYRNSKLKDGYYKKCIECYKEYSRNRYNKLSKDSEWLDKERERGREKYKRLNYKSKKEWINPFYNGITKNISKRIRARGINLKNKEAHHWNYNYPKEVFIISKNLHKLLHKFLILNEENKCFSYKDKLLNTKEKHLDFINNLINKNNINEDVIFFKY